MSPLEVLKLPTARRITVLCCSEAKDPKEFGLGSRLPTRAERHRELCRGGRACVRAVREPVATTLLFSLKARGVWDGAVVAHGPGREVPKLLREYALTQTELPAKRGRNKRGRETGEPWRGRRRAAPHWKIPARARR
ncbi:hypothetical protein NDU88_007320 [Pleurodeles waltl]|uniref:Uncharacterized protein n=1 Tax=Pleurodeles waltl TaxID=8319 RepID=A0AAV7PL05_PLEWA|nr:hypothetical protein NDU88_007320 [Pleurodeles waltl]